VIIFIVIIIYKGIRQGKIGKLTKQEEEIKRIVAQQGEREEETNLIESTSKEIFETYGERKIPTRLRRKHIDKIAQERVSPDPLDIEFIKNEIKDRIEGFDLSNVIESKIDATDEEKRSIPLNVRDEVWRRDQGKCVNCGSREKLAFDHIIPISKGGSNTARNIELLCEKCNRSKSDRIE
jgi:hypothetical protein